jgi:hypothetical protein
MIMNASPTLFGAARAAQQEIAWASGFFYWAIAGHRRHGEDAGIADAILFQLENWENPLPHKQ